MSHTSTTHFNAQNRLLRISVVNVALTLLAACGGGGGSAPSVVDANGGALSVAAVPDAVALSATLSGSIVKGPVGGSQVCVYELTASGKGKQLGCTVSSGDGSYSLTLAFQGEVVVEAVGGTYTDEATGTAGVPLSATLTSVAQLGNGPNVLHATPLTALAYARALAAGGLNLAEFQAKAAGVRDAFGLAADVDLARTLPTVATGSTNSYGTALHGVSKMLGMGATLAGVVGNADLAALKKAYSQALLCVPNVQVPTKVAAAVLPSSGEITVLGGTIDFDGSIFTVSNPDPAWRVSLSGTPSPMGCTVTANTADVVILNCPAVALQGDVTLVAGSALVTAASSNLSTSGVLVLGGGIEVQGGLAAGGNVAVVGGGVVQVPGVVTVGGNISISGNALTGTGSITSAGTLATTISPVALGTTSPVLCAGSVNGSPCGAAIQVLPAGGSINLPGSLSLACTANSLAASGALVTQSAKIYAVSGNLSSSVLGGDAVSLVSSRLQTNGVLGGKAITAGTLVFNDGNLGSNYGGGIAVTNIGTITNTKLSLSSSGQ